MCSTRNVPLHANEYVLPAGGGIPAEVCPQFVNLVILRNPISRCVSNIMHLHQMFIWNNASDRFPTTFAGLAGLAPRVVNNMYTRTLLGQRVFKLPYDAITEQHLQAAKLKLLQFDVLLLLEEPDKNDVLLQRMLGWKNVCRTTVLLSLLIRGVMTLHAYSNHVWTSRFLMTHRCVLQVHMAERKANTLMGFVPEVLGNEAFSRVAETTVLPLTEIMYHLAHSNHLDMVLYVFAKRLFEADHAFFGGR